MLMEAVETGGSETNTSNSRADVQSLSIGRVAHPNEATHTTSASTASAQTYHAIQLAAGNSDGMGDDDEGRLRREILARRPSYRRILNELSSDNSSIAVAKIEEESNESHTTDSDDDDLNDSRMLDSSSPLSRAQLARMNDSGASGLQTLTMTNIGSSHNGSSGPTILQYTQSPDGQFLIPVSVSPGAIQYQLAPSISQSIVMAASGNSGHHFTEDTSRKRELRLLKNREAARECRRKKKEYVKCLENRVAVLENQNKTLIEELKSLKELYCQKDVQS